MAIKRPLHIDQRVRTMRNNILRGNRSHTYSQNNVHIGLHLVSEKNSAHHTYMLLTLPSYTTVSELRHALELPDAKLSGLGERKSRTNMESYSLFRSGESYLLIHDRNSISLDEKVTHYQPRIVNLSSKPGVTMFLDN